jgi:hypothetical protein
MRVKNSKKYKIMFVILTLLMCYIPLKLNAQDFEVSVVMDMQTLSNDVKDKLKDFKQQVEDYYNRNKFANEEIYKIKATIQFSFLGSNGFDAYDAKVFVASSRIIDKPDKKVNPKYSTVFKYVDERCSFTYNRSMPFIYNSIRFDTFLSLLDYYAFIMLGFDADSYFPARFFQQKCGTPYFQKANDICNKPMSDRNGWTETGGGSKPSRLQLVQELLNPKFMDFRVAFFEYHWRGLDSLGLTKNAYDYIINAIEKISNIKKTEPKAFNVDIFFETKFQEIADTFLDYGNKKIYDKLSLLDPSHQRIYDDAKSRAH